MGTHLKIYHIASALGIDTTTAIDCLRALGFGVKNNMSKIDVAALRELMKRESLTPSVPPATNCSNSEITSRTLQIQGFLERLAASPEIHPRKVRLSQVQSDPSRSTRGGVGVPNDTPASDVIDLHKTTARAGKELGNSNEPEHRQFKLRLIAWHPNPGRNKTKRSSDENKLSPLATNGTQLSTQGKGTAIASVPDVVTAEDSFEQPAGLNQAANKADGERHLSDQTPAVDELDAWILEHFRPTLSRNYEIHRILNSPHILVESIHREWSILVSFNPDSTFGEPLRMPFGGSDAMKIAGLIARRFNPTPRVSQRPSALISRLNGRLTDHGWHASLSSMERESALVSSVFEHSQGTILKTLSELKKLSWARHYTKELDSDYRFVQSRCKFTDSLKRRLELPHHCVGIIDGTLI